MRVRGAITKRKTVHMKTGADYQGAILEHPLQAAVFEHWNRRGNKAEAILAAIPNGGVVLERLGRLKEEGFLTGLLDIYGAHRRTGAFWIELKRPGVKKLRSEQEEVMAMLRAAGQEAYWFDKLDAVLRFLEDRDVLKGRTQ